MAMSGAVRGRFAVVSVASVVVPVMVLGVLVGGCGERRAGGRGGVVGVVGHGGSLWSVHLPGVGVRVFEGGSAEAASRLGNGSADAAIVAASRSRRAPPRQASCAVRTGRPALVARGTGPGRLRGPVAAGRAEWPPGPWRVRGVTEGTAASAVDL